MTPSSVARRFAHLVALTGVLFSPLGAVAHGVAHGPAHHEHVEASHSHDPAGHDEPDAADVAWRVDGEAQGHGHATVVASLQREAARDRHGVPDHVDLAAHAPEKRLGVTGEATRPRARAHPPPLDVRAAGPPRLRGPPTA